MIQEMIAWHICLHEFLHKQHGNGYLMDVGFLFQLFSCLGARLQSAVECDLLPDNGLWSEYKS